MIEEVSQTLQNYEQRPRANPYKVLLFKTFLKQAIEKSDSEFLRHPRTLVHTDLVHSNIVVKQDDLKLIDWQRPMIGDPAYDV